MSKSIPPLSLADICANYLDNADLNVILEQDAITLNFRVYGKVNDKFWRVIFYCAKILSFDYELDEDSILERDWLLVLDVNVNQTFAENSLSIYHIQVFTHDYFYLTCHSFSWEIHEITEQAYH